MIVRSAPSFAMAVDISRHDNRIPLISYKCPFHSPTSETKSIVDRCYITMYGNGSCRHTIEFKPNTLQYGSFKCNSETTQFTFQDNQPNYIATIYENNSHPLLCSLGDVQMPLNKTQFFSILLNLCQYFIYVDILNISNKIFESQKNNILHICNNVFFIDSQERLVILNRFTQISLLNIKNTFPIRLNSFRTMLRIIEYILLGPVTKHKQHAILCNQRKCAFRLRPNRFPHAIVPEQWHSVLCSEEKSQHGSRAAAPTLTQKNHSVYYKIENLLKILESELTPIYPENVKAVREKFRLQWQNLLLARQEYLQEKYNKKQLQSALGTSSKNNNGSVYT